MAWQDECDSLICRCRYSRGDDDFNDAEFDVDGEKIKANRTILSLASPVMKAQFYGSLAVKIGVPILIEDGTARGFKAMLVFIYNEGEYTINDLLDGKEELTDCDDLRKVMELLYFGHKYQINSLISFGRNILLHKMKHNNQSVMNLLVLAINYKTILNSEYRIVNFATMAFIDANFTTIFKDAKITDDVFLAEDLMVELLKRQTLTNVSEGFVLQVALDYVRFCKDQDVQEGLTWINLSQRIIPKVIDFSKLSLKELDYLSGSFNILPDDVLLKIQTKMIEANKNGLVVSQKRNEGPALFSISIVKNTFTQLPAQTRSQVKLKVNQKSIFVFSTSHYYNSRNDYKCIVWKQKGAMKEVAEGDMTKKFFTEPNTEITVEIEMHPNSHYLYMLEDSENGKFKRKEVEIQIVEVNGKPFKEAIAFDVGVHVKSLQFYPI